MRRFIRPTENNNSVDEASGYNTTGRLSPRSEQLRRINNIRNVFDKTNNNYNSGNNHFQISNSNTFNPYNSHIQSTMDQSYDYCNELNWYPHPIISPLIESSMYTVGSGGYSNRPHNVYRPIPSASVVSGDYSNRPYNVFPPIASTLPTVRSCGYSNHPFTNNVFPQMPNSMPSVGSGGYSNNNLIYPTFGSELLSVGSGGYANHPNNVYPAIGNPLPRFESYSNDPYNNNPQYTNNIGIGFENLTSVIYSEPNINNNETMDEQLSEVEYVSIESYQEIPIPSPGIIFSPTPSPINSPTPSQISAIVSDNATPSQGSPAIPTQDPPAILSPEDYKRPPYKYTQLIVQALAAAPKRRLTVNEICSFIQINYPFYHTKPYQQCKNIVRNNLSIHNYFKRKRGPRPKHGGLWRMRHKYEEKLIDQSYCKRVLKKKPAVKKKLMSKLDKLRAAVEKQSR